MESETGYMQKNNIFNIQYFLFAVDELELLLDLDLLRVIFL